MLEADNGKEAEALEDFLQQFVGNISFLGAQLNLAEKPGRFFHGHGADFADVAPVNPYLPGFDTQPRAPAFRTLRISAITAQEYSHVKLVFLTLSIGKETAHAEEKD